MTEANEQLPTRPEAEVNAAWLADAITQLKTRGDAVSRLGCMTLPAPVFNDLCTRILAANGDGGMGPAIEWLHGQVEDAPSRSAVYRFAGYLREEYRTARSLDRRRAARDAVASLAEGEPEALQLALNLNLTERLAELLDNCDDLTALDPNTLKAAVAGVRMVSQTVFDKRKMDAALRKAKEQIEKLALENENLKRDVAEKQKMALDEASKAAAAGSSATAVVDTIKKALGIGRAA